MPTAQPENYFNKYMQLTLSFFSVDPDDLSLRMGEYDLNSDGEPNKHVDRKVQIVASHPKFDPKTFEYDLALLRFYEPVEFQPNIIPICIPEEEEDLVGETAWVTGWGRLYDGNSFLQWSKFSLLFTSRIVLRYRQTQKKKTNSKALACGNKQCFKFMALN